MSLIIFTVLALPLQARIFWRLWNLPRRSASCAITRGCVCAVPIICRRVICPGRRLLQSAAHVSATLLMAGIERLFDRSVHVTMTYWWISLHWVHLFYETAKTFISVTSPLLICYSDWLWLYALCVFAMVSASWPVLLLTTHWQARENECHRSVANLKRRFNLFYLKIYIFPPNDPLHFLCSTSDASFTPISTKVSSLVACPCSRAICS